ncbi:uncharacterized protein [Diadema antillarum]|uniref:uncharacterized protein isoform X1 n=1 Tax=Diadema antillarum TaxID=105358 RepID=UPI003A864D52
MERKKKGRPRSVLDHAARKRERDREYRERNRETLRIRNRCQSRISLAKNNMKGIRELQSRLALRSINEVVSLLLSRYQEEHAAKNQGLQGQGSPSSSSKSPDAHSLPSSISGNFREDDSESSGGKASLPASLPSPSAGSEHPAEPDSGVNIDISVSYIERGNFDYPDENPDNDSEDYDSDYIGDEPVIGCIRDGAKRKGLERKGEREEVLGMEQEEEEEEGTEKREMPTTKSGLDVKVEAQQAEDLEFILISSSRLAELARMAASQCSRCGAPLTTSVTPGNIVWKCPSGHKKVWSTRETLKRPHVGDIKLASSSWKRREPKYHHDVVIKLRPELEVVHKLTDNG